MITSYVGNDEIPSRIKQRLPFKNKGRTMMAFTDAQGTYAVFSYDKPIAYFRPTGEVEVVSEDDPRRFYKPHIQMVRKAL